MALPTPHPSGHPQVAAFTLIELLIVVAILAILAVMGVPQMATEQQEAVSSALMANTSSVAMVLDYQRHSSFDGSWPPNLAPDWFVTKSLPAHPERLPGVPPVETVSQPGVLHPTDITLTASSAGTYWYNAANGAFRARVAGKGTSSATAEFYNKVNHSAGAAGGKAGKGGMGGKKAGKGRKGGKPGKPGKAGKPGKTATPGKGG